MRALGRRHEKIMRGHSLRMVACGLRRRQHLLHLLLRPPAPRERISGNHILNHLFMGRWLGHGPAIVSREHRVLRVSARHVMCAVRCADRLWSLLSHHLVLTSEARPRLDSFWPCCRRLLRFTEARHGSSTLCARRDWCVPPGAVSLSRRSNARPAPQPFPILSRPGLDATQKKHLTRGSPGGVGSGSHR